MARIIVTTEPSERPDAVLFGEIPVLLDERVDAVHLSTEHAAMQLIERITWAVIDAEQAERAPSDRTMPAEYSLTRATQPLPATDGRPVE